MIETEPLAWWEPAITINGKTLTDSQSMTVRVALESFFFSLRTSGLGEDEIGQSIADGYMSRIREIQEFLYTKKERQL